LGEEACEVLVEDVVALFQAIDAALDNCVFAGLGGVREVVWEAYNDLAAAGEGAW
jgi:hypothetical protein